MSMIRYFKKIQLLDTLIRKKGTGNQKEFAKRVGISRALLNIYLNEMKELGFPINYNRAKCTYYYEEEGKIVSSLFEKQIDKEELKDYKGGCSQIVYSNYLFSEEVKLGLDDQDYRNYYGRGGWI
jgi:hypothetical protein